MTFRWELVGESARWTEQATELEAAAEAGNKGLWKRAGTYLKFSPLRGKASLRHGLRHHLGRCPVPRLKEFANLEWLRRAGFHAPRPILAGARWRSGWPRFQFLWTEELGPAPTLRSFLQETSAEGEREAVLRNLAGEVARMHGQGFTHRDLFPRNILVLDGPPAPRLAFLDAWRGGPEASSNPWRGPDYDLACFFLYGPELLTPAEQGLFLSVYSEQSGRRIDPRLIARLRHRLARGMNPKRLPRGVEAAPTLTWDAPAPDSARRRT